MLTVATGSHPGGVSEGILSIVGGITGSIVFEGTLVFVGVFEINGFRVRVMVFVTVGGTLVNVADGGMGVLLF